MAVVAWLARTAIRWITSPLSFSCSTLPHCRSSPPLLLDVNIWWCQFCNLYNYDDDCGFLDGVVSYSWTRSESSDCVLMAFAKKRFKFVVRCVNNLKTARHEIVNQGHGGSVVRARDWRSGGRGFESHSAAWKVWEFPLAQFACSVIRTRSTLKAVGPFYLVSTPGEVKDPTEGVNVTCRVMSTWRWWKIV